MSLMFITWDVDPNLFEIGPITVRWYGLLFATAFLVGHYIMQNILIKENQPKEWMDSLLIYMMVGTVLGARLGHVFFYQWEEYRQNILDILKIWEGGLASHGAAIGIILSLAIWTYKISKKPLLWILDRIVITVSLAAVFIRFGNLMNHEIVGRITDSSLGFKFLRNESDFSRYDAEKITGLDFIGPKGEIIDPNLYSKAIHSIASDPEYASVLAEIPTRYPAQLFEAFSYLLIFGLLIFLYYKKKAGEKSGLLFGLFLILLFTARFFIEFVKEVQVEKEIGMTLNMGQQLSIPLVLVGLFFVIRALTSKPQMA